MEVYKTIHCTLTTSIFMHAVILEIKEMKNI